MADLCKKCLYSCEVNVGEEGEMLRACTYILFTGKRRPCKPGKDCTVFIPAHAGAGQKERSRHSMEQRENAAAFRGERSMYGNSQ